MIVFGRIHLTFQLNAVLDDDTVPKTVLAGEQEENC